MLRNDVAVQFVVVFLFLFCHPLPDVVFFRIGATCGRFFGQPSFQIISRHNFGEDLRRNGHYINNESGSRTHHYLPQIKVFRAPGDNFQRHCAMPVLHSTHGNAPLVSLCSRTTKNIGSQQHRAVFIVVDRLLVSRAPLALAWA